MLVYRIVSEQFAADLSGEGARLYGGRWNPCGIPVLYTSESVALATLELLVNVPPEYLTAGLFSRVTITLPDDITIQTLKPDALPTGWGRYPAPAELAELGRRWFKTRSAVALHVPSVVVNGEGRNYLLNPCHPDYHRIRIEEIARFSFDIRLLRPGLAE